MTLADLDILFRPFVYLLQNTLKLFGFQFLTLSVADKVYPRNVSCTLNLISVFLILTVHVTAIQ